MARQTTPKPGRAPRPPSFWQLVPVKMRRSATPAIRAIAAVMTEFHQAPAGEPWTTDQVLQLALQEGLAFLERKYLGTDTLDECEPEEPATEQQLALARALVKALEQRS